MTESLDLLPSYAEAQKCLNPVVLERGGECEEPVDERSADDPPSLVSDQDTGMEISASNPTADDPVSPFSRPLLPPDYARRDPETRAYALRAPFIYATGGLDSARYQLEQSVTRSGRPIQLRMRPLVPSESRRLALGSRERLEYDDDTTLFVVDNLSFLSAAAGVEIRGCRSRTLPGALHMEQAVFFGGGSCKFWHVTRNRARDALRAENERRMARHGYHAEDEVDRTLMFSVSRPKSLSSTGLRWLDAQGRCVAIETDARLDLAEGLPALEKETLVACWVARCWGRKELVWHTYFQPRSRR